MNEEYARLLRYVHAASDLADSCRKDIKAGKVYTSDTVVLLAKFIKAAEEFNKTLANLNKTNETLN